MWGPERFGVEDETVVALAEVMDTYAHSFNSISSTTGVEEWEKEFQPAGQGRRLSAPLLRDVSSSISL